MGSVEKPNSVEGQSQSRKQKKEENTKFKGPKMQILELYLFKIKTRAVSEIMPKMNSRGSNCQAVNVVSSSFLYSFLNFVNKNIIPFLFRLQNSLRASIRFDNFHLVGETTQCGNILSYGTCLNCNSGTENSFTYDKIPESYDEVTNPPPQCHFNVYLCQICETNSHHGYECSQRVPLVYEPELCYNKNFCDNYYSHDLPGVNPLIDHHCCYKCGNSLNDFFCYQCTCEFCRNGVHVGYNCPAQVPSFQTLPNNIISEHPPRSAIIPNEPVDFLSMWDEHLNTTSTTESNEFIKSCVENLVPNPSESEGKNGCDVLACVTTFSNILFKADYESDSSDYQSCSEEDFSEEIFSNPLFEEEIISTKIDPHHFDTESDLLESMLNRDSFIISSSSKIDSLLDEFAGELTLLKSIPPGIDKTDCYFEEDIRIIERLLYDNSSPHLPEELVSENFDADIESFSPSPIPNEDSDSFMEEIDLTFTPDDPMPPSIEDDDDDSEGDNLFLERLLHDDPIPLLDTLDFSYDVRVFLPFFTYPMTSSILH
uniref:Uncharacterized protein n=1 Tax=Tanacetum cinerariifolium TaxID=118510 RepID=A0A6L2P0L6_TANCI|nr:hypothetical protein [Tanacetum cinerariifolium]